MTTAPIALSITRPWTSRSSPRRGADTSHVSESQVLDALRVVTDPDLGRDIVSLGFVKHARVSDGTVGLTIELTTPACPARAPMRQQAPPAAPPLPPAAAAALPLTAPPRRP